MELTPQNLILAYINGIFPMAHDDGDIAWYQPDPRAILPLDTFRISRRLARTVRQHKYDIRINDDFQATMQACAARSSTWINDDIIAIYTHLHQLGYAHSVEAFADGERVGGLYGVALGGFFAGESMFSVARDASKVALVHLVQHMRERNFTLLDTQFTTDHLIQFGVIEIPHDEYMHRLQAAISIETAFYP